MFNYIFLTYLLILQQCVSHFFLGLDTDRWELIFGGTPVSIAVLDAIFAPVVTTLCTGGRMSFEVKEVWYSFFQHALSLHKPNDRDRLTLFRLLEASEFRPSIFFGGLKREDKECCLQREWQLKSSRLLLLERPSCPSRMCSRGSTVVQNLKCLPLFHS